MRMFAAALGRDVTGAALENLEERLLHALAGNVAGDGDVVGLATDLIDLVDVDDSDLGAFHIIVGVLQEP
jgi:hypothetical protein